MGAIPTTMGGSRGAQAQEGSVTVSSVGLTQYLASAQHHGRQRRGTGPPSRAELSPAPLASVPASHVLSARWDLGTWGRRGGGVRVRHGTPQFIPTGGPNLGHTVTSTFWITLPKGQRKYPARSQQSHPVGTRASAGTSCVPPATGPPRREGTQKMPAPISAISGSARRPTAHPALHMGVPDLGLTIRSPHNGDKHRGSHKDIEKREPPAEEQQVEDVSTRHRGPCRTGGTGWDRYHLQQPKSTLPPQRVVPRATHLQSPG